MLRSLKWTSLLVVVLSVPAVPARAQYGRYGGWGGWGGEGGSTVQGSVARGMGAYAAGAGAYNEQTAEARSMNANTAMQVNEYMYAINQRNAQTYAKRQQGKIKETTEAGDATYRRLHDNPSPADVHSGDALNVVLDELTNPKVYTQVVQKAAQPIASGLVKNVEFEYAARMIAISLADLSSRGVPDVLLTTPAFEPDRTAIRALVQKAREESSSPGSQVSHETLANCREAIRALQDKVKATLPQGTRNRDEADNFLKALYGLTKMLESPDVAQFLKGLDTLPTTTLGHLITFMHSFNLRFGVPKNADQEAAYDQLYPLLAGVRDRAQAQGPNPVTNPVPLQDPKSLTSYFSAMDPSRLQPQPGSNKGAVPPPPAAGLPR
jgi:hypothetical protein